MLKLKLLLISLAIPPIVIAVLFFGSYFIYPLAELLNGAFLIVFLEHLHIGKILGFDMEPSGGWIPMPGNLYAFCLTIILDYVILVLTLFFGLSYLRSKKRFSNLVLT